MKKDIPNQTCQEFTGICKATKQRFTANELFQYYLFRFYSLFSLQKLR